MKPIETLVRIRHSPFFLGETMYGILTLIIGLMTGCQTLVGVCIAHQKYGAAILCKVWVLIFLFFAYLVGSEMGQDYADCGTTEVLYEGYGSSRFVYKKEGNVFVPCTRTLSAE